MLALLPAKRRPPELTWWAQSFKNGRAQSAPEELSPDGIEERLKSVDVLLGQLEALPFEPVEGLKTVSAEPSAKAAGLKALSFADVSLHPAKPAYVRSADAVPMKSFVQPVSNGS